MLTDRAEVRCPRDATTTTWCHHVINRSNESTEWTHKLPGRPARRRTRHFHSVNSYGHITTWLFAASHITSNVPINLIPTRNLPYLCGRLVFASEIVIMALVRYPPYKYRPTCSLGLLTEQCREEKTPPNCPIFARLGPYMHAAVELFWIMNVLLFKELSHQFLFKLLSPINEKIL